MKDVHAMELAESSDHLDENVPDLVLGQRGALFLQFGDFAG